MSDNDGLSDIRARTCNTPSHKLFQRDGFPVLPDGSVVISGIPDDVVALLPPWQQGRPTMRDDTLRTRIMAVIHALFESNEEPCPGCADLADAVIGELGLHKGIVTDNTGDRAERYVTDIE
jgi:hypothetical protein